MTAFDLKQYLAQKREMVEAGLKERLVDLPAPLSPLRQAMAHSLFAGGKRLRPILCLSAAEIFGAKPSSVMPTACALEFIHTYSLIHDDLPAMDDDDLRRGQPTCHKVFGEAMALLAGDALLSEAFNLLAAQAEIHPPARVIAVIRLIARAAGPEGMVGGQAADLLAEGQIGVPESEVEFIHARKTGALITASAVSGAKLAGAEDEALEAVTRYGRNLGAAFQIVDDLLDIDGQTDIIGKPVGSDLAKGKATYPAAVGKKAARAKAAFLAAEAIRAVEGFGPAAQPWRALAAYIIERER